MGGEETPLKRPRLEVQQIPSIPSPSKATPELSISSIQSEMSIISENKNEEQNKSANGTPIRKNRNERKPLAERLRPNDFNDFVV